MGPSKVLTTNGYRVFTKGKERPKRDADPSPPSSAVGHERVELYLDCPYGTYGLYRASVPVQGCSLPYISVPTDKVFTASYLTLVWLTYEGKVILVLVSNPILFLVL